MEIEWTIEGMKKRFRIFKNAEADKTNLLDWLKKIPFCHVRGSSGSGDWQLIVWCTPSFLSAIKKQKLDKSSLLYKALLNLRYGYDPIKANSPGGKDGIFSVTEDYKPKNEMVKKLYDRYIKIEKGINELQLFGMDPKKTKGVRVVSHGLRLLGFIDSPAGAPNSYNLALVDADINRR